MAMEKEGIYVIRASSDWSLVIFAEMNGDEAEKTDYYRYELFKEREGITKEDVKTYFSGQADGMGYGEGVKFFRTISELDAWMKKKFIEATSTVD